MQIFSRLSQEHTIQIIKLLLELMETYSKRKEKLLMLLVELPLLPVLQNREVDLNYQTLAGIGNDCFDKKEGAKPAAGGAAPGAPKAGGLSATHDPNYQTLAGIGNDCFQKK